MYEAYEKLRLAEHANPGRLIVFEGTDGAGKTTLIGMAAQYLAERLGEDRLLLTKQPTDLSRKTKLFQKMMYCAKHEDIDYRAVQLLTMSDRVQHNREVILPALRAGKIVISDRYLFTSAANMLARGYREEDWFFEACRDIVRPDLAFLAYSDPGLAIARIRSRPQECCRHLDERLLRDVAEEFLRMRDAARFRFVDTSKRPEAAFEEVSRALDKLLEEL